MSWTVHPDLNAWLERRQMVRSRQERRRQARPWFVESHYLRRGPLRIAMASLPDDATGRERGMVYSALTVDVVRIASERLPCDYSPADLLDLGRLWSAAALRELSRIRALDARAERDARAIREDGIDGWALSDLRAMRRCTTCGETHADCVCVPF